MSWYECYSGEEQLRLLVRSPAEARDHNRNRPEWPRITRIVRADGKAWLIDDAGATEIEQMRLL